MLHEVEKVKDAWHKFQFILTKKQKYWGIVILFMTLIGAAVETLGVSVMIPFVQAMLTPETLYSNRYLAPIIEVFRIEDSSALILMMGVGIAVVYILKNIYLTFLSYCRVKYSAKIQRELSVLMMQSYMKRGYLFFSQVNTGGLIRGINDDIKAVYQIMCNAFRMFAEVLTALAIVVYIMVMDIHLAVCVIVLAFLCFIAVVMGFRGSMQRMGEQYRASVKEVQKHSLQAFQGIKEIIVTHRQQFFTGCYEQAVIKQQKALIGQTVGAESPAYIIEAVCVAGMIIAVSLRVRGNGNAAAFIPQIASFAVGAFRILPSLGRITSSFNQIIYYMPSLNKTYENLKEVRNAEEEQKKAVALLEDADRKEADRMEGGYLSLENICWQYPAATYEVLHEVNMQIAKGTSVAFIGQSGAGKTTLADIILGLYRPQQGCVRFEGKDIRTMEEEWARCVGYIPQTVYLTDDTIRNNVAFGIEEPQDDMIWRALEQAQMKSFVESMADGLDTVVGDRGVRLSGGQRQRIAIARALYYDPQILILDEATSALDTETEAAVMDAINSLQKEKTLIIVAHRLTTIQNCDVIYEIVDGNAVERNRDEVL